MHQGGNPLWHEAPSPPVGYSPLAASSGVITTERMEDHTAGLGEQKKTQVKKEAGTMEGRARGRACLCGGRIGFGRRSPVQPPIVRSPVRAGGAAGAADALLFFFSTASRARTRKSALSMQSAVERPADVMSSLSALMPRVSTSSGVTGDENMRLCGD